MNRTLCVAGAVVLAIVCSCVGQTEREKETEVVCFKDSCEHLVVDLALELPIGADEATQLMRDTLIADFVAICSHEGFDYENNLGLKPFDGDMRDAQAVVDYYGRADYEHLLKYAVSDYEGRMKYIDEDETLSEADKEAMRRDVPQWMMTLNIRKMADMLGYVVYMSKGYVYYGGAHGGVNGTGALTFDKETGRKIGRFVREDATHALQPLIREGLLRYYGEGGETMTDGELSSRLQLMEDYIPQPAETPYPSAAGDSLVFTYRQYEIACYADGMPSFALAVSDLWPYMTEEGKALMRKANPWLTESEERVVEHKKVSPLPVAFDAESMKNCIVAASIRLEDIDWEGRMVTMEVWSKDVYDAVEVTQLAAGDTLMYDGSAIVVERVEETEAGMEVNGGEVTEGGCMLVPNEGGTYVARHIDMHATYTKQGTVRKPMSERLVLVNCGEQYGDASDTVRTGVRAYVESREHISFHVLNTLVAIEDGAVVAITRRWIP
ncbi:MAG: DUF3298 domain-containing protein [Bacteroidaceae bacterium]|nr:DUF3298 domain-containing protein [Bacteroidaceae bacterium]